MKKIYITLDSHPQFERRLSFFVTVVSAAALVLIVRFWYLQIAGHSHYLDLAEKSRIRNLKIVAPRGVIKDRTDMIIASSAPSFTLEVLREELRDRNVVFDELARILRKDRVAIERLYEEKLRITPRFYPVVLVENLERSEIIALESLKWKLKGLRISYKSERSYPFREHASHLLGYVSQITERDLEKFRAYQPGSKIGKAGLESAFEPYLKGFDGVEKVEVDASGRKQKVLYKLDPVSGGSVKLTLDWKLQEAAERAMGDRNGAVVALSPKTGEILAMVSRPNFDPNVFVKGFDSESWKKISSNPFHPLQNKAIQGVFPPGSTFKLFTAVAALEEGTIDRNTAFTCTGKKRLGNRDFRCWKDSGHGRVTVHRALVESCDVFFYETALRLGPEKIADYARKMGLGEKTGVGLSGELTGIVPSPRWKKERYNQRWYDGDTLPFCIGQGYLSITPLQLALGYATFVNGGSVLSPVLVREFEAEGGKKVEATVPKVRTQIRLSPETVEIVRKGLIGVVNEPGGTGHASRVADLVVGGKTGTAQVRSFRERTRLSGFRNDHAWFVGFAPAYDADLVVCAFIMHGGHGGGAAAPVVREVIEKFYSLSKTHGDEKNNHQ